MVKLRFVIMLKTWARWPPGETPGAGGTGRCSSFWRTTLNSVHTGTYNISSYDSQGPKKIFYFRYRWIVTTWLKYGHRPELGK